MPETARKASAMTINSSMQHDADGNVVYTLTFEEGESDYDTITVTIGIDSPIVVRGYEGEEVTFQTAMQQRDLSFTPISVIGRGETDKLTGVSPGSLDHDEIPRHIAMALNSLGFAPVPAGEDWITDGR